MHLDVTDASPARWALGIDTLIEGGSIELYCIGLAVRDSSVVISVFSAWLPENLTESHARAELERAQSIYSTLLAEQPTLARHVSHHPVRYELLHDYGGGAILLGTLDGETLTWQHPFRPKTQ